MGRQHDSGWNCTPCVGAVRWRIAITSPSSARAVSTKSAGSGSMAASEW